MPPIWDLQRNARAFTLAGAYAVLLTLSFWLAYELRFDFVVPVVLAQERLLLLVPVVLVQLCALVAARQFGTLLTYFSLPDLVRLVWAMAGSALLMFAWYVVSDWSDGLPLVPRGGILINFVLALSALCSLRIGLRLYRERMHRREQARSGTLQRVAIVGAGDVGAGLARDLLATSRRGYLPVVFFDDDLKKRGRMVHGIQVAGPPEALESVLARVPFSRAVLAMPSASAARVREVVRLLAKAGLPVETVPSSEQLVSGQVKVSRIRPVDVVDLLGRDPVDLDHASIGALVKGKVVMVTGAGGSIGGEMCRQILALQPRRLILFEQCEGALFTLEQELLTSGSGALALPVVGDILDHARVEDVLRTHRPQVIFHAAAHKHVYLMERQPGEAVKNNVLGTRGLAELAIAHGVGHFVLISTDKAINPTSVMGASKRLAELELQALHARGAGKTRLMAVRFGNVLGSSGSVIPIFRRQIEAGGPVTVTHPEVTRYFMTIPEAVGLVMQASVLGQGGEIFVLNMGAPVKIADLARQMIELSGYRVGDDIEIKWTGLKPGEKLYEELQHRDEAHEDTAHPAIQRFTSARHDLNETSLRALESLLATGETVQIKRALARLVPEYTPHVD